MFTRYGTVRILAELPDDELVKVVGDDSTSSPSGATPVAAEVTFFVVEMLDTIARRQTQLSESTLSQVGGTVSTNRQKDTKGTTSGVQVIDPGDDYLNNIVDASTTDWCGQASVSTFGSARSCSLESCTQRKSRSFLLTNPVFVPISYVVFSACVPFLTTNN